MTPIKNAVAERVNGILDKSFIRVTNVYLSFCKSGKESEIYNTERPHWSLYMQTPQQTKRKNIQQEPIKKNQTV
jgi:transposase InsO family protein